MMFSPLLCDHGELAVLVETYKIKYIDAIRVILDCRESVIPIMPRYNQTDRQEVSSLLNNCLQKDSKNILYFPINYSNKALSEESFHNLLSSLKEQHYNITFNVHGGDRKLTDMLKNYGQTIDIPGHLLPLVQSKFEYVMGIFGGAMSIALSFSKATCIALLTEQLYSKSEHIDPDRSMRGIGIDLMNDEIKLMNGKIQKQRYCIDLRGKDEISTKEWKGSLMKFEEKLRKRY